MTEYPKAIKDANKRARLLRRFYLRRERQRTGNWSMFYLTGDRKPKPHNK